MRPKELFMQRSFKPIKCKDCGIPIIRQNSRQVRCHECQRTFRNIQKKQWRIVNKQNYETCKPKEQKEYCTIQLPRLGEIKQPITNDKFENDLDNTFEDLTEIKYNHLTFTKPIKKTRSGIEKWKCRCDCGNYVVLSRNDVTSGRIKSCGCKQFNRENLSGKKFGFLEVIRLSDKKNKSGYLWECRCSCGKTVYAIGSWLRAGNIKSCGHVTSLGEAKIQSILDDRKIQYKKQFIFKDLKSSKGGCLKFDFAILSSDGSIKCLIEYQGIQHFQDKNNFGKLQRDETDSLKRNYCKQHGIRLYEIRYDEDIDYELELILLATKAAA